MEVRYWELWIKNEEFTGGPNGGKERYIRSLEFRRGSTWNIYIRWVYIVMHDFIWVLFTEMCSSYVARALVRLSKNLVEGTPWHSGYDYIYSHSSDCSLRYVLNSECHSTRLSSPPTPKATTPLHRTAVATSRSECTRQLPDARRCSVCNHDCLYLSIKKGNGTCSIFRWHVGLWLS